MHAHCGLLTSGILFLVFFLVRCYVIRESEKSVVWRLPERERGPDLSVHDVNWEKEVQEKCFTDLLQAEEAFLQHSVLGFPPVYATLQGHTPTRD